MTHQETCAWAQSTCEYKPSHHYCPHPEHACTCAKQHMAQARINAAREEITQDFERFPELRRAYRDLIETEIYGDIDATKKAERIMGLLFNLTPEGVAV